MATCIGERIEVRRAAPRGAEGPGAGSSRCRRGLVGAPFLPRLRPVPTCWRGAVLPWQPGAGVSRVPGAAAGAAAGRPRRPGQRQRGAGSRMRRGWLCGPAGPRRRCAPESSLQVAPVRLGFVRIWCGDSLEGPHREGRCEARVTKPQVNERGLLVLQDFKVGNLLGKGSFAGVYRAVSLKTGLEVAIKMVRQAARKYPSP